MRVISGQYKSIKLKTVDSMATRPTTDKVKESLFNIIDPYSMNVLDLFAGSGGLGIETLSRGAEHAIFIDASSASIKVINENIAKCKIDKSKYEVYKNDYLRALKIFSKKGLKFDLVILDPPYRKGLIDDALSKILELDLLNDGAIIICEFASDEELNISHEQLDIYKEKKYGTICVKILEYWSKQSE